MRLRLNLKGQLNFYLKSYGWTPAELARRSGAPKQSISDWMAGTPPRNLVLLKKVADTLQTTVDNLLFGQGIASGSGNELDENLSDGSARTHERQSSLIGKAHSVPKPMKGSDLYLAIMKPDGTIVQINGSFQKTLGWPHQEIIGRPGAEFIHAEDHKSYKKLLSEYRLYRKSMDGVFFRLVCKDGTQRWVQWQSVISEATQLIHCIGNDLTVRFSGFILAIVVAICDPS